MDRAPSIVAQIQLGKCRPIAARERRLGTALLLQLREDEFDVLASPQLIGRVVRTSAEVVARLPAANGHAIAALRLRIADAEFGKERLGAEILQAEVLFAAELATQCALPFHRRDIIRRMSTGKFRFLGGGLGPLRFTGLGFHEGRLSSTRISLNGIDPASHGLFAALALAHRRSRAGLPVSMSMDWHVRLSCSNYRAFRQGAALAGQVASRLTWCLGPRGSDNYAGASTAQRGTASTPGARPKRCSPG